MLALSQSATKTLLNWAIKIALIFRKAWNPKNFKLKAEELLGEFHGSFQQLKANPKSAG